MRVFLTVMILIASLGIFAQNHLKNAKREMMLFNYSKAVQSLEKQLSGRDVKSNCEATLILADCYRMMNDVANAKTWYAKAIAMEDQYRFVNDPGPVIYLHYAQALRSAGDYLAAKRFFLKYDSLFANQHHGTLYAAYCDSAIAWRNKEPVFGIRNVTELNNPQSEFGTVFYHKGIVFASDRFSTDDKGKTYGWTGNGYLNLYYTEPVHPDSIIGYFMMPRQCTDLPQQRWHDGPVTFNSDFTWVFINRTQVTRDQPNIGTGAFNTHLLKIFSSRLTAGKWSTPEPFFLNSKDYSVGHPALSNDGKTLFFVSDMPGGYGETDIWYCHYDGHSWSEPVNLGPVINTSGKEMFPSVGNGTLYFASDGLPGFGGLDLFLTGKTEHGWSTPQNLGVPINSSYDDLSLIISKNEDGGLFSSNRPGGSGGDDIYSFRRILPATRKSEDSTSSITVAISMEEENLNITRGPDTLQINKNYRLENIFYDFDKWDIRADAKPSLGKLIRIMNEYPVSVELGSHTDCRGTELYNMQLSQKRAESAVQYIISQGISTSRIVARGYGESQLLNNCNCNTGQACSEADHQSNRRTEFKIISKNMN
ncbi:MAG: OmpA family protein [Bacteroidales bacterium]|nr:OmpA family protein [Bacteroidales bacterium]